MSNEGSSNKNKPMPSSFGQYWSNAKSTPVQTVTGGFALCVFIMTWLVSVGSPFLCYVWIMNGQYLPISVLLFATIISYLPWEKGYISGLITAFARCNTNYYQKCSVIYQSKESVPATGNNKEEQRPMLYAVHPHGAFSMGWSALYCSKTMNDGGVRFCFSSVLYASPLFRLWGRLVGIPGSASKASMIGYMKGKDSRNHLALPPGGFEEATLTSMEKNRVYIKKRMGFVKLALQHGYNVVPVYSFGENQTFWNLQGMWKFRHWLNGLGLPAILVWGSWFAPLLPKRHPRGLKVVVGEPLVLPKIPNPTREDVQTWHDKYIASLVKLFEEHKEEYYGPELSKTTKLELW